MVPTRGFLKGRKLWRYVTGDITCPVKGVMTENDKAKDGTSKSKVDVEKDFVEKLEDWEKLIWDQLTSCEPVLKDATDAKAYEDYYNHTRLIQFLMTLTDDYEPFTYSFLHQTPLPGLEDTLPRLKYKETRLRLTHFRFEKAFVVTDKRRKFCRNDNRPSHILPYCPSVECRKFK
ncbi:hypothetical protein PIB30_037277 [Stylosanthes scabra]|uniref:Uncharacterized protein n=1 Tax=Stylosanthes scabra TaxID=79078 RepID=A0ABU6VBX0_9FABA|nr:hypothetical protein [Stylosanthes scabra]